jgi:hypothetical protein
MLWRALAQEPSAANVKGITKSKLIYGFTEPPAELQSLALAESRRWR